MTTGGGGGLRRGGVVGVMGVTTLGSDAGDVEAGTGEGTTLGGGAVVCWEGGVSFSKASWKIAERSRRAPMWGSVGAREPAGVGFMMA